MTCWYEGPLAAFDTETTGVDVETDRIVSAAVVVQDAPGTRPRVTRWLVNPGVPVPEPATAVHGLTDEHLQRNGRWPAPVMQEIAEELAAQAAVNRPIVVMNAPFDLTLLPVGAYDEHWPDVHMNPEEAVRMHADLGLGDAAGGVLVPVHWATFNLAFHPWAEPITRLLAAAESTGATVRVPMPGQRLDMLRPSTQRHWWLRLA